MTHPVDETVLWTVRDVAKELGATYSGARTWLRRQGVPVAAGGGRGCAAMYDPDQVRAAKTDQLRRANARTTINRWVR
jgi:hypothetical protein